MSLTKPSINESESLVTRGTDINWSSSPPMTVRVTLATMKRSLAAKRKQLVKRRRNELAAAARARKNVDLSTAQVAENNAKMTLDHIRKIDARLGLLDDIVNEKSTYFEIDLRDKDLKEFGFGMDDNGNYPAL